MSLSTSRHLITRSVANHIYFFFYLEGGGGKKNLHWNFLVRREDRIYRNANISRAKEELIASEREERGLVISGQTKSLLENACRVFLGHLMALWDMFKCHFMRKYIYICIYIYLYVYIDIYLYVYIYISIYICVCVCVYISCVIDSQNGVSYLKTVCEAAAMTENVG